MKLVRGVAESQVDGGPRLPPSTPAEPRWADLLPGPASATLRKDAARAWASIVPELDRHGVITKVDEPVLVDACVVLARIKQCERLLSREGLTKMTDRGPAKNPLVTAVAQYRTAWARCSAELGLSPSSRSRLPWDVTDDNDDFERLLSGPRSDDSRMVAIPPGSPMGWTPPV
jgi:P27 family predicted phage terminase small subunit